MAPAGVNLVLTGLVRVSTFLALAAAAEGQAVSSLQPDHPTAYPLFCRGGGSFAFDTLRQMEGVPIIELAMSFSPGASAALSNGTGLAPGTCAWADRPLNAEEPAVVRFTMLVSGMAGPQDALGDPGRHWRFLVHSTGQGHLESDAHAAWTGQPSSAPGRPLPSWFPYFVLLAAGAVMPLSWIQGRLTSWTRLAERYPAVSMQGGRRIHCGFLVVGRMNYNHMVRLTASPSHLHLSMMLHLRPGYPSLSIPWSDITATHDVWRWFLIPTPVVRLRFARDPEVRFLIRPRVAEEVMAGSDGRLVVAQDGSS